MSKNQQKTTFNTSAGLLNSLEPQTQNTLNTAEQQGTAAEQAFAGLGPAGISSILSPATTAAGNLISTGGFQQPQLNTLESTEAGNLSGLDPASLSKLSSQYQDLISSGGISDATAAAMQRQAISGVSGIYNTIGAKQARDRAVTGGQGGYGETAQLARNAAEQESQAVTDVNAKVGQLRQQGTEAGLSGASSLEASQAAARDAAARTFGGTLGSVAGGVQTGTNILSDLDKAISSGSIASAGGLADVYGLTNKLYGTQLGGEQGFLGLMADIANKQKGPLANAEDLFALATGQG